MSSKATSYYLTWLDWLESRPDRWNRSAAPQEIIKIIDDCPLAVIAHSLDEHTVASWLRMLADKIESNGFKFPEEAKNSRCEMCDQLMSDNDAGDWLICRSCRNEAKEKKAPIDRYRVRHVEDRRIRRAIPRKGIGDVDADEIWRYAYLFGAFLKVDEETDSEEAEA